MLSKTSKWELGFVHYIAKFTILRFTISKFESASLCSISKIVLFVDFGTYWISRSSEMGYLFVWAKSQQSCLLSNISPRFPLINQRFSTKTHEASFNFFCYLHFSRPRQEQRVDILFSSNHNIHKSSYDLCSWASDPLIDRFY